MVDLQVTREEGGWRLAAGTNGTNGTNGDHRVLEDTRNTARLLPLLLTAERSKADDAPQ